VTQRSVPEPRVKHGRDSTRAVTTDRNLADQIAAVLLCDREPIRDAFVGEPVMEAMLMCAWALDHEADEGFDAARALTAWARKRSRGAWREDQPTAAERTQYGSSDEQHREMQEAVESGGKSVSRSSWGVRFTNEQVQRNLDRMQS
jgi:hypothetical protein